MKVRMGLIRKKDDWTHEKFLSYWRENHGPLAAKAPNLREYWQNAVTDRIQRGITFARGPWNFDGYSQLYFDDAKQADDAFKTSAMAAALIEDENRFLGELHIVTAEQNIVIPVPDAKARAKLLKRMSTLKRLPNISEEDFRREWIIHRDLVRKMPGVGAYRQNVIMARERTKGVACGYEDLPIDGIVELWFENPSTLEAAFSSPAGQSTMRHAQTFLHEITVFSIDERRIV